MRTTPNETALLKAALACDGSAESVTAVLEARALVLHDEETVGGLEEAFRASNEAQAELHRKNRELIESHPLASRIRGRLYDEMLERERAEKAQ